MSLPMEEFQSTMDALLKSEEKQHPFIAILAVDASKQAKKVVEFYLDNIHRRENRVVLLHVIELPDAAHGRHMNLTPTALHEMWTEEGIKAHELKEQYVAMLKGNGVEDVLSRCEAGLKPGQVIVSAATEERASIIVIGTRGVGVIRRTIFGSVSDYVIHHAHCPVVIGRFPNN